MDLNDAYCIISTLVVSIYYYPLSNQTVNESLEILLMEIEFGTLSKQANKAPIPIGFFFHSAIKWRNIAITNVFFQVFAVSSKVKINIFLTSKVYFFWPILDHCFFFESEF